MEIDNIYNMDCLELMRTLPDKCFQLAIADPPYGIKADKNQKERANTQHGKSMAPCKDYGTSDWDMQAPDQAFFDELRRVSRNQIVWGANHFIERLPINSPCWIVWDKKTGDNCYADCELAWTSFDTAVRKFDFMWKGMFQQNMANKEERIHPTQKPVALYAWLLQHYAKPGDHIFDPMMGSQSSRIAAYKLGFDYVGCELDKEYFTKGCERFDRECKGITVSESGQRYQQTSLFAPNPDTVSDHQPNTVLD